MYSFLIVIIALNILDVYTTYKILSGGGREVNSYVKWFIDRLGLLKGLLASKIIIIPFIWCIIFYQSIEVILLSILLLCFYIWVVFHNLKQF